MSTPSLLNIPYRLKAGTLYSQLPETGLGDFVVTRSASNSATRVNAAGLIETVLDNVPRLDYPVGGAVNGCPALLVEPAATNSIRNNSMVGAVSGGALPTNWSFGTGAGVSGTVTAVGTENGIPYIDLRINGTATATSVQLNIEAANQIAALNGQVWTISSYLKTIASPFPPLSSALLITERTSGGATSAQNTLTISLTSSLARYPYSVTLNGGPTTAFAQPRLSFTFTIGQPYDFTIRIGYPQMELGSVATSVIPTTTAAVTRSAETIIKTGISSLIGQTEGTIYAEVVLSNNSAGSIFLLDNGSTSTFLNIARNTAQNIQVTLRNSGGTIATIITSSALANGVHKIALSYTNGAYSLYINGSPAGTSTNSTDYPASLTRASISTSDYGAPYFPRNDRVRAVALYPNRLPNTAAPGVLSLATLTTP